MEITVLTELVNNVGFPVMVCFGLFWFNRETVKHYEKLLLEFRNTIDRNTKAMDNLFNSINKR